MIPDDLQYTPEHEWVRIESDGTVTFGITHHAQDALGDIVYCALPAAGTAISAGRACGEVESTKSVSDIYAPIDGTVVESNPNLDTEPQLVNQEPYGAGWMVRVQPAGALGALLSAAAYEALIAG